MPSFNEHISQANKNLMFLQEINSKITGYWDWHVTASFYCAVHLANAHIVKKANQHYRSHDKVGIAINPYTTLNPSKFSEESYIAYKKLLNLSRRSRYLVSDEETNHDTKVFFTSEKHCAKAIRNLDCVIKFFSKEHSYQFPIIKICCAAFNDNSLEFIKPEKQSQNTFSG